MILALYSAATGMHAQERRIDVQSNNMANTNTTAYKRQRADFQDLFYDTLGTTGVGSMQLGHGVRHAANTRIFSQGDIITTNRPSDVAIQGDGFFRVTDPVGGKTFYTRDGSFHLNTAGILVTSQGYELSPTITIAPTNLSDITIDADGSVKDTSNDNTLLGTISVYSFINQEALTALGGNVFEDSNPSLSGGEQSVTLGINAGDSALVDRSLESANVKLVEEMIRMITSQRAYEANSKTIQTADSMLQEAANLKR